MLSYKNCRKGSRKISLGWLVKARKTSEYPGWNQTSPTKCRPWWPHGHDIWFSSLLYTTNSMKPVFFGNIHSRNYDSNIYIVIMRMTYHDYSNDHGDTLDHLFWIRRINMIIGTYSTVITDMTYNMHATFIWTKHLFKYLFIFFMAHFRTLGPRWTPSHSYDRTDVPTTYRTLPPLSWRPGDDP